MISVVATVIFAAALQAATSAPPPTWGLPLEGKEAEEFLRTAKVLSVETFKTTAITRPKKIELSDGKRTAHALFKTVDEYDPLKRFADGGVELQFTDSFEYEIAAYELDKLLGLGVVPPAIRRRINREVGSLSLWVEGAMTEWERLKVKDIHPPDLSWDRYGSF